MSSKEPKAFSDIVAGDVVWAKVMLNKDDLKPPPQRGSRNSTYELVMRGKAVFKYVVVLKRNDKELIGATITTFNGATELPLNKVGKKEHWYPVSPATGHYEGLPQTDGTPAWVCINNVHIVTGPDPIPTLAGNTYSQEAIDLIITKLKEFSKDI